MPGGNRRNILYMSSAPVNGRREQSIPAFSTVAGCVAALVRRDAVLSQRSYVASQDRCIGGDGRVAVEFDHDTIWLGGYVVTCVKGSVKI